MKKSRQQQQGVKARKAKARAKAEAEHGSFQRKCANTHCSTNRVIRRSPTMDVVDRMTRPFHLSDAQLDGIFGRDNHPVSLWKGDGYRGGR